MDSTVSADAPLLRVVTSDLSNLVGLEPGSSGRALIDQERIDKFADATGDRQWIHVDPQRAEDGPFGTTITHGYLTLSPTVTLSWDSLEVAGSGQITNSEQITTYGLGKVRFRAPVPVDSELDAVAKTKVVDPVSGAWQLTVEFVFYVAGVDRPVCVAEMILRYLGEHDIDTKEGARDD